MFKLIIVLMLFAFDCQGYLEENDECNKLGILFYEDIGCKPVKVEGKKCPVQFECDDFTFKADTCLFQSKTVKVGEKIDDTLTESNCKAKCVCNAEQRRQNGLFTCLSPICPRPDEDQKPGCYTTKMNLNECCDDKMICPSDDVVRCVWIDGHTHYGGSRMDDKRCDKSSCFDCVCQKGFSGKLVEPFCKRRSCLVQLKHSDKLAANCAPVYFGKSYDSCNLCCPNAFACSKDIDVIQKNNYYDEDQAGLKCKFGNRTLKLGEGVETTTDVPRGGRYQTLNVTCKCDLPPFLTCRET